MEIYKLRLSVNQAAITVLEYVKARGVGFEPSTHKWGFLGLSIIV
jgi:hypothetical protein